MSANVNERISLSSRIARTAFFTSICFLLVAAGCAQMAPPPGGPRDEVPPTVTTHTSASNATRVALYAAVTIRFSETMDRRSVEEHTKLYPYPGEIDFSWKGTAATLSFSPPLSPERTYICSMGKDARDYHQVAMGNPFSFAFSTGDDLARGRITGKVWHRGKEEEGALVWAYMGDETTLDEHYPDPKLDPPHYVAETDSSGDFFLSNLHEDAEVRYRLYAFKDLNRNRRPDFTREPIGVTLPDLEFDEGASVIAAAGDTGDVAPILEDPTAGVIHGKGIAGVRMFLRKGDDSLLGLVSARGNGSRRVDLTFSREPLPGSARSPGNYRIESAGGGVEVYPEKVYRDRGKPLQATLITSSQEVGELYRLSLPDITDLAGRGPDTLRTSTTFLSNSYDPAKPILVECPLLDRAGAQVPPLPEFEFFLSREVCRFPEGNFVELTQREFPADSLPDTSGVPSVLDGEEETREKETGIEETEEGGSVIDLIHGRTTWVDGRRFTYTPADSLEPGVNYRLTPGDSLQGWDGERVEQGKAWHFSVREPGELGSIRAVVTDWESGSDARALLRVIIIDSRSDTIMVAPDSAGVFQRRNLPLETYGLEIFADQNGNDRWDSPDPYLLLPGEPWVCHPDDIELDPESREIEISLNLP